jgi:hypothetical protein
MNSDSPIPPGDQPQPAAIDCGESTLGDWRYWCRRLLLCNPFYLCSAAFLLFGVNRLSLDPDFLGGEMPKLIFNFSALQSYGVLLVGTAILLARRRVLYDSALLVVMDHGLALVPFILISQAALIDRSLAWTLSLAGGVAALARAAVVRRFYSRFNLPLIALLFGLIILGANVALPLFFRSVVSATTVVDWPGPNRFIWLVLLPLLTVGANLLPRPERYCGLNPERPWLPLFIYGLWIAGSGVHVWCLGYLAKIELTGTLLAPTATVIAWTLWNRRTDFVEYPPLRWERCWLATTFVAPLLAAGERPVLFVLVGINSVFYAALWLRRHPLGAFASRLLQLSLVVLLAAVPDEWLAASRVEWGHSQLVMAAGFAWLLWRTLRSTNPRLGLVTGLALVVGIGSLPNSDWPVALEIGLAFVLTHSVRWRDEHHAGAALVRGLIAGAWAVHALLWTQEGDGTAMLTATSCAAVVSGAWACVRGWRRGLGFLVLPVSSAMAASSGPFNWMLKHGAPGLIALVASLVLFAIGTWVAWHRRNGVRETARS